MVEVLAFLFEGFVSKQINIPVDIDQIARELPEAGFKPDEINAALEWLSHTLDNQKFDMELINSCDGFRIYNHYEATKLTEEAKGLICFLEQNNMITPSVRELIIDRAMDLHVNYVGKEELRWVLLFVMMNSDARIDILTWIEKSISDSINLSTSQLKLAEA